MTPTLATRLVLVALALAGAPPPARAANPPPRSAGSPGVAQAAPSELTPQQEEMLALASSVARRCEVIIEKWLAAKEIRLDQLFNHLYYPVPDTEPRKYTTDWDHLADRDFQPVLEDALTRSGAILFVVVVDEKGYLPTHNLRYSQPLTGNRGSDLVNNRTKRMFVDRTGIAAARNEAPYLIQAYQRDTGEVAVDLSVPIRVQGAHWGAVRVGFRQADAR